MFLYTDKLLQVCRRVTELVKMRDRARAVIFIRAPMTDKSRKTWYAANRRFWALDDAIRRCTKIIATL
jgi:hypothetical protein